MHGHRLVERLDANQYHLHGLPSAFPTSRNPVGHHGSRLPGGPEWIAHMADRTAADEDRVIQLPGHHVVAAQPDVHHLDKLGGDWGSSQRGHYMHPNAPPPTFPEYTGRSWHSWGDGGHYGWAIFCNAPRTLAELQATSLACTWQYETNDTPRLRQSHLA